MEMVQAVIVDALRSPMGRGKATGALAALHPVELLAQVLTALVTRNGLDPGSVDDVLVGCVGQNGEQSATVGRQAWLAAGFPVHVPAATIERKCGSGQQAVDFAVQGIAAGAYDIAIAAGVESMSRVPIGSARMGADPYGPSVRARFPDLVPQGVSAELVAQKFGLSREDLDAYSARSHARAARAAALGAFGAEIVPVRRPDGAVVRDDETIRAGTTVAGLAQLKPAFGSEEMRARFPSVEWKITAGNSSQITDGAAAVLVMSEGRATRLGLRPRARVVASAVCGDDPVLMLTGPIPATERLLKRTGIPLSDIGVYEVNEAFSPVPLAWMRDIGAVPERLNPLGGAIALGHPLGASGASLMTRMVHHMREHDIRFGLQTMCEGGGTANATLVELVP
jgi:acetyl-CoA acetyltransferase family protein